MKKKNLGSQVIINALFIILIILFLLPFMIIFSTSLTSTVGFANNGYSLFPYEFNLDSYKYIVDNFEQILSAYGTSIFVSLTGTAIGIICMTAFAYSISRNDYKFGRFLSIFIYFTMLFSGGTVASYIWLTRYLGLLNNVWVLILPIMINAYNIFILRVGCKNISLSLIESAKLEGLNEIQIFIKIVMPLAKTTIATISLLMIFSYWNEWYLSMMYMDQAKQNTIQYYLVRILGSVEFAKQTASGMGGVEKTYDLPNEGIQMAICVIAVAPMMFVFPFFQKYFVSGISVGAVKG